MRHIFNLLAAVILFTACGCSKDNLQEQLPPATQTGANTFGCLFNGKVFTLASPGPAIYATLAERPNFSIWNLCRY